MPERGQAGAVKGGGVRPGIQQYGNVRGKKPTALEKLADKKAREQHPDDIPTAARDPRKGLHPRDPVSNRQRARDEERLERRRKSYAARKAATNKAGTSAKIPATPSRRDAPKRGNEGTTARQPIPEERTVRHPGFDIGPPPKGRVRGAVDKILDTRRGRGRDYNPNRTARVNPRATAKGLGKVAAAAAGVTAGSAILGGNTDRTGSKKDGGLQKIEGGRYRATHDIGGRGGAHDAPHRPLPSTASTGPAKYQAAGNRIQAAAATSGHPLGDGKRRVGTQGVPAASTGIYSTERGSRKGGVTDEQVAFAKGQLAKAGYKGRGTGRQVVNSFKALNQGVAKRRAAAGAPRAGTMGRYSALAAGDIMGPPAPKPSGIKGPGSSGGRYGR